MRVLSCGIHTAFRNISSKSATKPSNWNPSLSKIKTEKTKCWQPSSRIEWGNEQKHVLSAISQGKSVFITGSAGTGKTLLLKEVIKSLKNVYKPSEVSVTASTGIAACALNGQTLHSFAGINHRTDDLPYMLHRVLSNKTACKRWQTVEALVIDEISMIDAALFDNIEYIAREVRGVNEVWGGIQLVVSGDFFQLPPISRMNSAEVKFAFEADCWNESFDLQVELTKIFRQSDSRLIKLLQGIRMGESDPKDLEFLEQMCLETKHDDPSVVQLFPLNKDVERVNEKRLKSLKKKVVVYTALDHGSKHWIRQLSQGMSPNEISLCEGARVMLIKNLNFEQRLVNGATGYVVGFSRAKAIDTICRDKLLPIVKFDSGITMMIEPETWDIIYRDKVVARRKQIPLILAWAMSIHKCQGMTIDSIHTNLSRAFGCGMVYVALSRVRSLDGLHISGFSCSKIKTDPKVLQFHRSLASEHFKEVIAYNCNKQEDHNSGIIGVSREVSTGSKETEVSQFNSLASVHSLLKRLLSMIAPREKVTTVVSLFFREK